MLADATAIDMILDGMASGAIDPAQIETVECGVGYRCENTLPYHNATTGLEGKFSMEYCLAAALAYGRVTSPSSKMTKSTCRSGRVA